MGLVVGTPAASAETSTQTFEPVRKTPTHLVFDPEGVDAQAITGALTNLRASHHRLQRLLQRRYDRAGQRKHARRQIRRRLLRRLDVERVREAVSSDSELALHRASYVRNGRIKVAVGEPPTERPTGGTTLTGYAPRSTLGAVPTTARYLSPSGSDSNPGTREAPWRTLAKAQSLARPGDTFVLLPGTYGAVGTTTTMSKSGTASAPITYRGEPGGALPKVIGHVKVTGSYQRLNYLLFDGPTGQVKPSTPDNLDGEQCQILIYGPAVNGVEISDSEIRDSGWHAGIYLSTANDVRITGNYIHDNGDFSDPVQENASHGIYFSHGSGLIANNVIDHNVARGVQLYTSAHDVTVANNTITRNGKAGILFASATARSTAVNNLVAYNGEYGIRSLSLTGTGNVVRSNLAWGNPKSNLGLNDGLTLSANVQQNPGFGPSGNYRPPAGSPAVDGGLATYAPAKDFDAVVRPRGAGPDLGAFETG